VVTFIFLWIAHYTQEDEEPEMNQSSFNLFSCGYVYIPVDRPTQEDEELEMA